jgi:hypothetical protein
MVEVSQEDREKVRTILRDVAEFVRKKYDLPIPEIRNFLREMLQVSI